MERDIFKSPDFRPLAERIRAKDLDSFVGQQHILNNNSPLFKTLESGVVHSMILWGPPGCGKTTLASLLGNTKGYKLVKLSAVLAGVKEVREQIINAKNLAKNTGEKTILFLDEVHRFNKSQQDAFLPFIEDGTIVFVGATTENPSFSLNNALLSRAKVYVFEKLNSKALQQLAIKSFKELNLEIPNKTTIEKVISLADGDGRKLINLIEITGETQKELNISFLEALKQSYQSNLQQFDNKGDSFYDLISAMHKSIRGSNPDAAIYWFCRMVEGGCDINYLARRLTIIASEDIGNADPRALQIAINGWQAYERIGAPEGNINLAQVVTYLASAAKSNASYLAYKTAINDVRNNPSYPIPNHLVNAPTKLMKQLNKGKGYRYAHDEPNAYAAGESYFPNEMQTQNTEYYQPNPRGLEIKISEKLKYLKKLDSDYKK